VQRLPDFRKQFLETVDRGLRRGGEILKTRCWLCVSINVAPNLISYSAHTCPSHPDDPWSPS
jgi:hypothetical protein